MKKTFECNECGTEITYESVEGNPYRINRKTICDECYHVNHQYTCPICEDWFDIPKKPQQHYIYSNDYEAGISPGFYRILNFPIFRSDGFSGCILEENIKKISDNLVYKWDRYRNTNILRETNFICQECFNKKGIDNYRVESHIRQELTRVVKTDRRLKKHNWTIKISQEYFKGLETKNKHIYKWKKNIRIKSDKSKQTQEIEIIKQK